MKAIKFVALAIAAATLGACAHKSNPAPVAPSAPTGYVQPAK
jgi:hypothetical protein